MLAREARTCSLLAALLAGAGALTCALADGRHSVPICDGAGSCRCPIGSWRICDGSCVDPRSDPRNCGACGTSCGDRVCRSGACADDCGELERCGDVCRMADDPLNCGACGRRCRKACAGNVCEEEVWCGLLTSCEGRCVDLQSDIKNCGQCGKDCLGKPYCVKGACADCPRGKTACYGKCVDLETDDSHCGSCSRWCRNDSYYQEFCDGGSCVDCPSKENKRVCHGKCVSMSTDENCGGCDQRCTPPTHCNKYSWCQ